jgi:hypothetical protein
LRYWDSSAAALAFACELDDLTLLEEATLELEALTLLEDLGCCCCWDEEDFTLLEDVAELPGWGVELPASVKTKENFWPSMVISSVSFSVFQ